MSKMRFAAVLSQKSLTDGRVFRHDTILRHQSKKATKRLEKAMIGLLQVPFTVPMCFWVRMHAVWPSREKAGGSALAEERCHSSKSIDATLAQPSQPRKQQGEHVLARHTMEIVPLCWGCCKGCPGICCVLASLPPLSSSHLPTHSTIPSFPLPHNTHTACCFGPWPKPGREMCSSR